MIGQLRAVFWAILASEFVLLVSPGSGALREARAVSVAAAGEQVLFAGAAKVDITDYAAGPVHDPSYAKALVLRQGESTTVLITVDAVAIGGIGYLDDQFLPAIRQELAKDPGIAPERVIVNASHCHGVVRRDSAGLVVQVVREAAKKLQPVSVGAGVGEEAGISENRRVILKDGSQVDMRRAYSFAWDDEIASIGPIDPQVGLLRIDREDGHPMAVVYSFACHPIMNWPSKGSSADFPGYASAVVESAFGEGTLAFFVQGCGGDINPLHYKEPQFVADAKPLGHQLGMTVLRGVQQIKTHSHGTLCVVRQNLSVPLAADYSKRVETLEAERQRLVQSLQGTNINFKSFLPLYIQQSLDAEHPAAGAQSYLHEQQSGGSDLVRRDEENRRQVAAYLANIQIMERITRLNTNLALLKKNQQLIGAMAVQTLDAEVCGLRIGDFKLVTFPSELTVEVGLQIKNEAKDPYAFVAGYTNGYLYYTPTVEQRANSGFAQEDCDCIVAPEWQRLFTASALEVLKTLED
jgi:hypothetical protein